MTTTFLRDLAAHHQQRAQRARASIATLTDQVNVPSPVVAELGHTFLAQANYSEAVADQLIELANKIPDRIVIRHPETNEILISK